MRGENRMACSGDTKDMEEVLLLGNKILDVLENIYKGDENEERND